MQSDTLPLPRDVKMRRLLMVALFLGLLFMFRKLAPVFICFVVFERALSFCADQIDRRTPLHRKGSILAVLGVLVAIVGLGAFMGIRRLLPFIARLRANGWHDLRAIFEHPDVEKLRHFAGLEGEALSHAIKEHAGTAIKYATATAHLIVFLLIGFLLAVIYMFERDQLHEWLDRMHRDSVQGTLIRWFGYVSDSIAVTVKMQVVVALVNGVVTLPVLLLLGLPHIPLLVLLIVVTGLVPVVGNVISGLVLCYVAYTAKGAWAVGVFLGVTFVLHKIESYYLNPRLAAEHVKLPGLVLVVSLLLFEQTIGFVGLFLSFPALYVASRVYNEWHPDEPIDASTKTEATPAAQVGDGESKQATAASGEDEGSDSLRGAG
jgi:predicted PurR-regulated permease PerM